MTVGYPLRGAHLLDETAGTPSSSKRYELRQIRLSEVVGVDEPMLDFLKTANLTPSLPFDSRLWKPDWIALYLDENPFLVRAATKGYFCIGGFRRFRLALAVFIQDPDHQVNVLVRFGKLSTQERKRLIAQECFLASAVERADRSDAPEYFRIWEKLGEEYSPILGKRQGDFDRAMGFLPRNKKPTR
ncbi:MAG: hypothetical protein KGL63_00925 [Betaproteobacteria bacterium]|nr:hypothetical protein [Betaproteobacteria bacterium]